MSTVPGPLFVVGDRWPFITLLVMVAGGTVIFAAMTGLLAADLALAGAVALALILVAAAPFEIAAGGWVMILSLVVATGIGYGVPLALDQIAPALSLWLMYAGMAFLGIALGSFQALKPRPLCFVPGLNQFALHWSALLVLWLAVEAFIGWQYGLPVLVHSIVVFASGLLVGLGLRAGGLLALVPRGGDQGLRSGINEVQKLIDQHKLPAARRRIDALLAQFPRDLAVRRMRYAVWKFEPQQVSFHRSAADLLARREVDGGDKANITALYKDYLAVTQGRPQLPTELHLKLARRFADWDDTENSANIVNLYLQRETNHADLPDAMLKLADAYVRTQRLSRAEYFADTLITMLPTSGEAQMAQRLLRQIKQGQN